MFTAQTHFDADWGTPAWIDALTEWSRPHTGDVTWTVTVRTPHRIEAEAHAPDSTSGPGAGSSSSDSGLGSGAASGSASASDSGAGFSFRYVESLMPHRFEGPLLAACRRFGGEPFPEVLDFGVDVPFFLLRLPQTTTTTQPLNAVASLRLWGPLQRKLAQHRLDFQKVGAPLLDPSWVGTFLKNQVAAHQARSEDDPLFLSAEAAESFLTGPAKEAVEAAERLTAARIPLTLDPVSLDAVSFGTVSFGTSVGVLSLRDASISLPFTILRSAVRAQIEQAGRVDEDFARGVREYLSGFAGYARGNAAAPLTAATGIPRVSRRALPPRGDSEAVAEPVPGAASTAVPAAGSVRAPGSVPQPGSVAAAAPDSKASRRKMPSPSTAVQASLDSLLSLATDAVRLAPLNEYSAALRLATPSAMPIADSGAALEALLQVGTVPEGWDDVIRGGYTPEKPATTRPERSGTTRTEQPAPQRGRRAVAVEPPAVPVPPAKRGRRAR